MEILRFIRWQWRHIDTDTKRGLFLLLGVVGAISYCIFAGIGFPVSILITLSVALGMLLFMWLKHETMQAWEKYQLEKEREAQKILNRLSGRSY